MSFREDLNQELHTTLDSINIQISQVWEEADESNRSAYRMMDTTGGYILTPLLAAKAQVLSALVDMEKINE